MVCVMLAKCSKTWRIVYAAFNRGRVFSYYEKNVALLNVDFFFLFFIKTFIGYMLESTNTNNCWARNKAGQPIDYRYVLIFLCPVA